MRLLDARDYPAAISRLRALLKTSDTARIRLELARALFYQQYYREGRALFREVLLDPETPWRVRDNIEAFLRDIDNIEGYLRVAASVVRDSNPRNISSQREFTIGGFRLTYVPPADNKPVTGLRYTAQAFQPVSQAARVGVYLTGSYLDYPGISLDRVTIDTGLSKGVLEGLASAKIGVEAGTFGNKRLYEFPYVAAEYAFARSPSQQLIGGLKLGKVKFPDFGYLDARYASATLSAQKTIPERTLVSARGTVERSDTYEPPYSYDGVALGLGLTHLFSLRPILLAGSLALARRRYQAVDPFFGEQRFDRKTNLEFVVQNKEWRWRNLKPALVFGTEQNRSNIDFFSYRKANISIAIE